MLTIILIIMFSMVLLVVNVKAALNTNLEACWSFTADGSDDTGSLSSAAIGATLQTNSCPNGNCYYFDGAADQILVQNDALLDFDTDTTLIFWANLTNANDYRRMVDKQGWVPANTYLLFRADITTCIPRFAIRDTAKVVGTAVGTAGFCDNYAHQFALVINWTGEQLYLYQNGTEIARDADISDVGDITSNVNMSFGLRIQGGRDVLGDMDEFMLWSRALSPSEINEIYTNNYNCTYVMNPPGGDVTPPVLSLYYPNQSTYNSSYFGIEVNGSEVLSSCSINQTGWSLSTIVGNHSYFINNTHIADGNYSFFVNCTDASDNEGNTSFWVAWDRVSPISTLTRPLDTTIWYADVNLILSYYDLNLWRTNTTILNGTGAVKYNNYSGNIQPGITWYNISYIIDYDTWAMGTYTLVREATDRHTVASFKENPEVLLDYKDNDKIMTYKLDYGDVQFIYDNQTYIENVKETDRLSQIITTTNKVNNSFRIRAESITYLPKSEYPCHMILNFDAMDSGYWYDCQGLLNPQVYQIYENEYMVTYDVPKEEPSVIVRSLGGLNYVNWYTSFVLATPVTATCLDCLNTSINCSLSYNESSSAYKVCSWESEKMMLALGLFVMITLVGFVAVGGYVNNIRLELENVSVPDGEKALKRIKTEMMIKGAVAFTGMVLLLTVVGFAYYAAQQVDAQLTKLVLVYWIFCFVGVFSMAILCVYKMFTFPLNIIGEWLVQQKRNIR